MLDATIKLIIALAIAGVSAPVRLAGFVWRAARVAFANGGKDFDGVLRWVDETSDSALLRSELGRALDRHNVIARRAGVPGAAP